jgi:hypothetical protein
MVATRRPRFDFLLEVFKKSPTGATGVREFSRSGEGSFFLMKSHGIPSGLSFLRVLSSVRAKSTVHVFPCLALCFILLRFARD